MTRFTKTKPCENLFANHWHRMFVADVRIATQCNLRIVEPVSRAYSAQVVQNFAPNTRRYTPEVLRTVNVKER